ncbi:MAG: hypothetical protein WC592_00775 [Candidatus Omnitrophota bacterium]
MLSTIADKIVSITPPRVLSNFIKAAPRRLVHWKRDASFKHIVRYTYRNSRFYREKFDSLKINPRKINKPSDLGDFYTTPIDIMERAEDFICGKPEAVFESSGTTGRNKRIYLTQAELDHIGRFNAAGFFLWGLKPTDRLVNAFDFCIWIPGMVTQKGIEKSRIFALAAGKVDPMEVYKRIPIYNINVVLGEPTWLIKLTEIAEKEGAYPLKLIIGGAEEMPDAARPWMEKVWKGAKVKMVYASVESGGIIGGEVTPECGGYHIDEDDFMVEIAEPDKDGYGEVTFTTLGRATMPLIRYRNGDISRIMEEPCACGMPYRRLEKMRGRSDELIVASGGNLYPLMFEEILKDIDGLTSDWQIVFKLRGIKEIMEFNIELRDGFFREATEARILENIKNRYPDLWKNYSIAIFEIAFACHPPSTLRAGKHKLLRIIDDRYAR